MRWSLGRRRRNDATPPPSNELRGLASIITPRRRWWQWCRKRGATLHGINPDASPFWKQAVDAHTSPAMIITSRVLKERYAAAIKSVMGGPSLLTQRLEEEAYKPGWRDAVAWLEQREERAEDARSWADAVDREWPWPT